MLDDYQMPTTRPVELYMLSGKEKFSKCPAFYVIWILWLIFMIGALTSGNPVVILAVIMIDTATAALIHMGFSLLVDIREYLFQMSTQIERRKP